MTGLTYIDSVLVSDIECTTDRLILRLQSDGDPIKLVFSHHAAIALVEHLKRTTYPLHCAPDGEVVPIRPKPGGKRRAVPHA